MDITVTVSTNQPAPCVSGNGFVELFAVGGVGILIYDWYSDSGMTNLIATGPTLTAPAGITTTMFTKGLSAPVLCQEQEMFPLVKLNSAMFMYLQQLRQQQQMVQMELLRSVLSVLMLHVGR